MKKRLIKLLISLVVIASFMCINFSFASDLIISKEDNSTIMQGDDAIMNLASPIYTIAKYITYAAAVMVVIYKGVQFMNSAADPEGKAKLKKELIAVVIGAALIFAIGEIITVVANVAWSGLEGAWDDKKNK